MPTDIKSWYDFGGERVVFEKNEVGVMKHFADPGLLTMTLHFSIFNLFIIVVVDRPIIDGFQTKDIVETLLLREACKFYLP